MAWNFNTLIVLVVLLLTPALNVAPVQVQSAQLCFPETEQCVSGRFRAYSVC